MHIGDQEITRNDMPAQIAWREGNPDHLRQSFQDVLNAKLGTGMQMPQTPDTGMMQTQETQQTAWK